MNSKIDVVVVVRRESGHNEAGAVGKIVIDLIGWEWSDMPPGEYRLIAVSAGAQHAMAAMHRIRDASTLSL